MWDNRLNLENVAHLSRQATFSRELANFYRNLAEQAIFYKGLPVMQPYHLAMFQAEELAEYQKLVEIVYDLQKYLLNAYRKDFAVRALFALPAPLEELLLHASAQESLLPVMRLDTLSQGEKLYVCEINTDGSSGMTECVVSSEIIKNTQLYQQLAANYTLSFLDTLAPLAETLLSNYRQWCQTKAKKDSAVRQPKLLIVDYLNALAPRSEFAYLSKYFIRYFSKVVVADVRDLQFKDGKLYYKGENFELLYRRAVTVDVLANWQASNALLAAYLADAVCLQGNFTTQLLHNKQIFALLRHETLTKHLPLTLQAAISKYFPETHLLADLTGADLEKIRQNPANYVLKACDSYAGKDVYLGVDYQADLAAWQHLLANLQAQAAPFIVQAYIAADSIPYYLSKRECLDASTNAFALKLCDCQAVLGLYAYNGKFIAPYLRIGRNKLVTGGIDDFTVPMALANKKF